MVKKKVVVIGGGHGQSTILRGLKQLENLHLTTIVTVADDGGSTGRIRKRYDIPAMGDVRNVMLALADSESLLSSLMDYRFEPRASNIQDIEGHNLGNLMLTALTDITGSFMEAISNISQVLKVKGDIIPSTVEVVTLLAEMEDGTIIIGESNIPKYHNRIKRVFYNHQVKATSEALTAILEADIILFGIGSLYTSILPNIIIDDIRVAINQSKANKIYLCNVMSELGETDNYSLEDHVRALEQHLEGNIDCVIYSDDEIPTSILSLYDKEFAEPVVMKESNHHYKIIKSSLLEFEHDLIRHSPLKISEVIKTVIEENEDVV